MNLGQSSTERPDASAVTVEEVMSKNIISIKASNSVQEAAVLLAKNEISALPVVDENAKLLGVLSDDDLIIEGARLHIPTVFGLLGDVGAWPPSVLRFERELKAAFARSVGDAMSKKVISCAPSESVEVAATLMHDHKIRMLPVVKDGTLVGVITRSDILKFLFVAPQD